MSPGIGWVRGGLANFREPIGIRHCVRVVVAIGSPDGCHWPPKIISVFGVIESNHPVCARQSEGRDMRPMCELRLCGKIRRCGLVVARRASEDIQNRLSIRSVIDPQSQDTIRYGPPYEDTFVLVLPSRNLCQGLLQFVIE